MKNIIKILSVWSIGVSLLACSDLTFGDKFLGDQPESSGATLDSMFNSKVNADKVLTQAYCNLPYGLPTGSGAGYNKLGVNLLEALTDLHSSYRNNIGDGPVNLYYNGMLSPNITSTLQGCEAYRFGSQLEYHAIRYAYLYIENLSKVPDMTETERNERIAEAKTLIALSYAEMLRYVGGVPILTKYVDPNDDMNFPRATFDATVKHIIGLLDEAIPDLKWKQTDIDDGRMTKAGAMGLKIRVLLFAASPTFNGPNWREDANGYTCYGNYDVQRWKDVVTACENFMTELNRNGIYELTMPEEDTHEARRLAFRSGYYDRGGTEVLISTRRGYNAATHQNIFDQRYYSGPTLNYVNMFPWSDGKDFDENFNWSNPPKQPFFDTDGTPLRDPRLYETVAVPGDKYFNGTPAPIYTNHPNYRADGTGFLMMKFILTDEGTRANRPVQWPYLRLPEVLLSYAEALNEVNNGPTATAYNCINQVRARVGLSEIPTSGMDKKKFLAAILKERALEFGFEEVRWFDLIRHGMVDDFKKPLYGLITTGNDAYNPTEFTFKEVFKLPTTRYWSSNWDTKWYLQPIPQNEINKAYGMTQNPGW